MSKHTPGPWTVGGPTGYINQLEINPCIGVVYGAGEELRANARLIAAAPNLLEALEDLVCLAEAAMRESDGEWSIDEELRDARAVIAQVKGKQIVSDNG
jgi:hypothetical protein